MSAAWYALIVLLLLYVLSLMDRQIIALMVTPLRRDLRLTDVEIGFSKASLSSLCIASRPFRWAGPSTVFLGGR